MDEGWPCGGDIEELKGVRMVWMKLFSKTNAIDIHMDSICVKN
jgi:hypothetical protein